MDRLDNRIAYFRNEFVPLAHANVSVASSPFLYGLSVYTVFGVHRNAESKKMYIFRLREHYDRLVNSCKIVDFNTFCSQWSFEKFEKIMRELIIKNNIREDTLVRVNVFIDEILGGTKTHGLKTSIAAFTYPLSEFLPMSGASLCISSWIRTPDNAIPARAKVNGSYINATLMKNEALLNGYDDAISVDEHGHICESTVANIFLVKGDLLITPSGSSHLLEGITRDSIFELCDSLKIKWEQRNLDRSEIYLADEIFLCGSSAKIVPVTSVDKRKIGNGKPGKLTLTLTSEYEKIQNGQSKDFSQWRTSVQASG